MSVKTVVEVVIESAHLPDDLGISAPHSLTAKSSCDAHGSTPGSDGVVQHQFSLPVVNNQSAPTAASDSPSRIEETERLDDLQILVVDDERDAGEMLEVLLARFGAEVKLATSAEAALLLLDQMRFDLLISDIGMPDVNGYEFIRRVRRLPTGRGGQTPAIALTAYARTEDRLRALRAGYQMHVPKPVDLAELIAVIISLAKRSKES